MRSERRSSTRNTERRTLSRSIDGCTICKVKSARHPFSDSSKWKKYFIDVFNLSENRTSEICHLCLKCVNKWRRAHKDAKPDFKNIVDSRYIEPPNRRNSAKKRRLSMVEMEFGTKEENKLALMEEDDLLSGSNEDTDDADSTGVPDTYFDSPSPNESDTEGDDLDVIPILNNGNQPPAPKVDSKDVSCQTSFLFPSLTSPQANKDSFKLPYIDLSKWRQEQICCGVIFKGPSGEVLVDPKWLNPSCSLCNRSNITPNKTTNDDDKNSKEISMFDEKLVNLIQSSS